MSSRSRTFTANGPQLVAEVLLEQRNLGLHREHDVAERVAAPRFGATPVRIHALRF